MIENIKINNLKCNQRYIRVQAVLFKHEFDLFRCLDKTYSWHQNQTTNRMGCAAWIMLVFSIGKIRIIAISKFGLILIVCGI